MQYQTKSSIPASACNFVFEVIHQWELAARCYTLNFV